MLAAAFTMTNGLAPATGVPDEVGDGVGEAVGVGVAVAERVGVGVGDGVPVPECVGVGEGAAEAPGVAVGVADPDGVDGVTPICETSGGVAGDVPPPPPHAASPTPAANAKTKTCCDRRGVIDERVRLDVNRVPRLGM
jgi:hypothetical protein